MFPLITKLGNVVPNIGHLGLLSVILKVIDRSSFWEEIPLQYSIAVSSHYDHSYFFFCKSFSDVCCVLLVWGCEFDMDKHSFLSLEETLIFCVWEKKKETRIVFTLS